MNKRLFIDRTPGTGTVVLNWHGAPEREFRFIAEAFRTTAKESVDALREHKSLGLHGFPLEDFRAYPIVFLYRHALELYMKAALICGGPVLALEGGDPVQLEGLFTHALGTLRNHLERVFTAFGWDWDLGVGNLKTYDDFCAVIEELEAVDKGGDAFRYPVVKKETEKKRTKKRRNKTTRITASLPKHFSFNVFDFSEFMEQLLAAFDGIVTACQEELYLRYQLSAESNQTTRGPGPD